MTNGMASPDPRGASWQALSGDHRPDAEVVPHYPYAHQQPAQQPPYPEATSQLAEPQPTIVPADELEPVVVPRYHAPRQATLDPRQRTMASVITFIALVLGLWGILGFMGSLSKTLTSISNGNQKLKLQLAEANTGLASLDEKTTPLVQMTTDSEHLAASLSGIDRDMGSMLGGVGSIADGMTQLGSALETLDSELAQVNDINAGMAKDLGQINAGLGGQLTKVRTMRRDVQATGGVLGQLRPRLNATNARLRHVNGAVNTMGCQGITNQLGLKIKFGPLSTGSAKVNATVVPPGAWGTRADGVTPC